MKKNQLLMFLILCVSLSLLPACSGGEKESSSSAPTSQEEPAVSVIAPIPEPEPVFPYTNPLTGEGAMEDIGTERPIVVMFNNLEKALPQLGIGQADVIYEIVAEGGITRLMGLYQELESVDTLGPVRSARDYYVSLAFGHDAIYVHAGGSPQAYDALQDWGMSYIDFVNGPYGEMCWRDPARRKNAGFEHSLLTSGQNILSQMPSRFRRQHQDGYQVGWEFQETAPSGGQAATSLTVPFSTYKTGHFSYDPESGGYSIRQTVNGHDHDFIDGNDGQPVSVRNVLVLYTDVSLIPGDSAGRMSVRTTGSGTGLLLRDGQVFDLVWTRERRQDCYSFSTPSHTPLPLAPGTSYINVVSASTPAVWK